MKSLLDKQNVERKIDRINERLKHYEDNKNLTEYGYESRGYLMGKLNILEDLLDKLGEEDD